MHKYVSCENTVRRHQKIQNHRFFSSLFFLNTIHIFFVDKSCDPFHIKKPEGVKGIIELYIQNYI